MKTLLRYKLLFIAFIIIMSPFTDSWGQDKSIETLVLEIKSADELPLEEANELLLNKIENCDNIQCKTILYFNLGYFYHKEANKNSENQGRLYETAKGYYQKAKALFPNDIGVLNNLALVYSQLNKPDSAIFLLNQAMESYPSKRSRFLINIAEIYAQNESPFKAIDFYLKAMKENPDDINLAWKALEACYTIEYSENNLKKIISIGDALVNYEHYLPAKSCFELALKYANNWQREGLLEEAILKWTEIISLNEQILSNELGRLSFMNNSQIKPFEELNKMINRPLLTSYSDYDWWTENEERKHIAASVLKGVASRYILSDSLADAVRIYELALEISPKLHYYSDNEYKKEPVRIDIAITLAGLFHKYKQLDESGRRFERLEKRIFGSKNMYYLQDDLFAMQRSHIILAYIYVERNQYESREYAHDAIFQLERAIRFQERINAEYEGFYKPAPHLNQLLAEGYEKTGNNNASETYLKAAMGYLDTDNLKLASDMIEQITKIEPDGLNKKEVETVKEIIELRKEINLLNYNDLNKTSFDYYQYIVNNNSLFNENQNLDNSFINRQRFKVLSDAGRLYSEKKDNYTTPIFEAKALETIINETNLTSAEDYYRMQQISESLESSVMDHDSKKLQVYSQDRNTNNVEKNNQKSWFIASDNQSKTKLSISTDLLITATVYNEITNTEEFRLNENTNYDFKVNNGELILPKEAEMNNISPETINRLNSTKQIPVR